MAVSKSSSDGNFLVEVINSVHSLAVDVGPHWGLALLLAILLFLPKWGVVVNLAALWKEDRADARKRNVEYERLRNKLSSRGQGKPQPPQIGSDKKK